MQRLTHHPLVSVIIPVYNVAPWVEHAIESILCQTYKNLEAIIIDDGSTDNTAQIVNNIKDPRVRLISTDHRGLFCALNTGIAEANGKYIARMDGDDISHPYRIEKQIDVMEKNQDCLKHGKRMDF